MPERGGADLSDWAGACTSNEREDSQQPEPSSREQLIAGLIDYAEAVKDDRDLFIAGVAQLGQIINFLITDLGLPFLDATKPVRALFADLNDLARGARPSRLQLRHVKGQTKPTNLYRDIPRAYLVEAVDVLMSAGVARLEAARWVSVELRRFKGNRQGSTMPQTILQWRARASGSDVSEAMKMTADDLRTQRPPTPTLAEAYQHAQKLIETVAINDFSESPRVNENSDHGSLK